VHVNQNDLLYDVLRRTPRNRNNKSG